jgi:hypothetical protein
VKMAIVEVCGGGGLCAAVLRLQILPVTKS